MALIDQTRLLEIMEDISTLYPSINRSNKRFDEFVKQALLMAIQEDIASISVGSSGLSQAQTTTAVRNALDSSVDIESLVNALGSSSSPNDINTLIGLLRRQEARASRNIINASVIADMAADAIVIAAPPPDTRIVIDAYSIINTAPTTTEILLKSGSVVIHRTANLNRGQFNANKDRLFVLGAGEALVINLSVAVRHFVNVTYFLENTITGLPV
jgi:hypothetical protein